MFNIEKYFQRICKDLKEDIQRYFKKILHLYSKVLCFTVLIYSPLKRMNESSLFLCPSIEEIKEY